MKKIAIISIILLFSVVSFVHAGPQTDKNCGCGLGTQLFKDKSDGLLSQVCAAITNGTSGNQTFGITSGTLGCTKYTSITLKERLNIFAADNMDNIAADIASGQGETLEAIADLAEVPEKNRADLYAMLQNIFDIIYHSAQVNNEEVVQKITVLITQI